MTTTRQTVVQPLGLVLTPNTYGQYPAGALSNAQNVVMRAPGEIWAAPGFGAAQSIAATGFTTRKLFPVDNGNVYGMARDAGLSWAVRHSLAGSSVSLTLPSIAVTTGLFNDNGQIWPVRSRERMLTNTATCGVFVIDNMAPVTLGAPAVRSAGMPQPHASLSLFSGATLPINVAVSYAAILRRTFADGYQIVSVPSPVMSLQNTSGVVGDVQVTVLWDVNAGVIAGDFIEIYRSDGLLSTSLVDPGDTLKLVDTHVITSGEAAAGSYVKLDLTACLSPFFQTPGRELYTNPGQETALQANRQPNINNAQAGFKSYTFYGDITERPAWTFTVPTGVSDTAVTPSASFRANGLGLRRVTGTVTIGSAVITGVSAADIVGIKIGQIWAAGGGFPAGSTVSAVGATTITMNALATSVPSVIAFNDVILLDGVPVSFGARYATLAGQTGTAPYELTADGSLSGNGSLVTGIAFTFEPVRPNKASFTVAATNGANYQPPVPEFTATPATFTRKRTNNLLQWSKDSEPEHVPPSNELNIGTGTIVAMAGTKNALWIFCTDGLYRLSGDAPPWRVDLMDPSCILTAPQALTQFRDVIFAYTNYGFVAVSDTGIEEISTNVLDSVFTGPPFSGNPLIICERDELNSEIVTVLGTDIMYVFNTVQKAWTTVSNAPNSATTNITALAFQRSPASGVAGLLVGTSFIATSAQFRGWGQGTTFLDSSFTYQPLFGDDPLVMKNYVDETFIFQPQNAGINVIATEQQITIGSGALVTHNSDAYLTVGMPRRFAISQTSSPGCDITGGTSNQFKFRGVSQRFVYCADQAWRK